MKKYTLKDEATPILAGSLMLIGLKGLEGLAAVIASQFGIQYTFKYVAATDQMTIFKDGNLYKSGVTISDMVCFSAKGTLFVMDYDPFNSLFEEIVEEVLS